MNQQDLEQLKEEIKLRNSLKSKEKEPVTCDIIRGDQLDNIAFHCQMILRFLGQNLEDENLKDTPQRMARYLIEFLNYDPGNHETVFSAIQTDQMVIVRNIPFWSLCSHHLLLFHGKVSVGYLTAEKVIGLSKVPRIVQKHAHKLQLQERLAHDIADDIEQLLEPRGVGVVIQASHSCMQARGIRSDGDMVTSVLRGQFREEEAVRLEFFNLLKG